MKKRVAFTLASFLVMLGCSNQPELKEIKDTNQTKTTKKQELKDEVANKVEENATVNTENTKVEVQTINQESINVNVENKNQNFAKNLAKIVIYFDFDKYNIRPDQWPKVENLAKLIKDNNSNYTVRIEGNCDEWGTEEYNYALGLKRANSVKNALIKLGVDPKKLTIISYGELNPVCTAHARWCWKLNRRDNFTYLP